MHRRQRAKRPENRPAPAARPGTAVQRASGHAPARALTASDLAASPRLVAQREALEGAFGTPLQRQGAMEDEELLQGRFSAQRQGPEEDELLQGRFEPRPGPAPAQRREDDGAGNRTGMPDSLKAGLESLSGMDMSDVRVHTNSPRPAQLNALAYAQGRDIHLGPGQQQHLPHEAWHIVQQAQGRVDPTAEVGGEPVNDDSALEREADVMGARAARGD